MPTKFKYPVKLIPIKVTNKERNELIVEIKRIPYLLYEVEALSDGRKIVINKPGGKRNFGRLSKEDFMVFIYAPEDSELWLLTHNEIHADIDAKLRYKKIVGMKVIKALKDVCDGKEPDDVLKRHKFSAVIGLPVDLLLKVYKWIWAQEDVNYPKGEGRWRSMNALLEKIK